MDKLPVFIEGKCNDCDVFQSDNYKEDIVLFYGENDKMYCEKHLK